MNQKKTELIIVRILISVQYRNSIYLFDCIVSIMRYRPVSMYIKALWDITEIKLVSYLVRPEFFFDESADQRLNQEFDCNFTDMFML